MKNFTTISNYSLKRYLNKVLKLDSYKIDYRLNNLPSYLNETLIGVLLSDGSLEKPSLSGGSRLSVNLGEKGLPYILHLYNLFEPFIDTDVNIKTIKLEEKIHTTVRFKTISTPFFSNYYNVFYPDLNNNKKIVPKDISSDFTEVSLAHLIMGDGNFLKERNMIRIYTNAFTEDDVLNLSATIKNNLNLNNEVFLDRKDQFIIRIHEDELNKTRQLVLPYLHPSMYYRVGLNVTDKKFDYSKILNKI
uniref:LAGLIDADG endonuclease n=1 Tax=Parasitella parasitica TaxID=35722 RepID=A0A088S8H4_9FUNG|nr:LAGLIDADG endonuclease [Parasitella parasitica]AIO05763.1 LAGLIDADG endonuclease [Parasitella parasitica]